MNERNEAAMNLESGQIAQSQKASKFVKRASPSSAEIENLTPKTRPKKRLRPIVGKKVDTIDWYRGHLERLIPSVEEKQRSHREKSQKPTGAVFIEFETLSAAQAAFQEISYQSPMELTPKSIGASPESIIWSNLDMSEVKRHARLLTGTSLMTALTVFWSVPVVIIGSLSNIDKVASRVPFLKYLEDLPPPIIGAIQGLVPTLLLSVAISFVPMICRYLAKFSGEVTQAGVEMRTQVWYFAFQVIHVFLLTTIASGFTAVISNVIEDPKRTPKYLAENLPQASNFYISYFIVYGLGQSSFYLLRGGSIFFSEILGRFLDNSPRKKFERLTTLEGLGWGSIYPKFTNLAVIGRFPWSMRSFLMAHS